MLTRLLLIFCFTTIIAIWVEAVRNALLTMTGGYVRCLEEGKQRRAQFWMDHRPEFAIVIRGLSSLLTSAWSVLSFDIICKEAEQTLITSTAGKGIVFVLSILLFAVLKESLGSNWLSGYRDKLLFSTMFLVEFARRVARPYIWFIMRFSNKLKERDEESDKIKISAEDEILSLVDGDKEGDKDRSLESDEKRMIRGIFNLGDRDARDVMTPRNSVIAINEDSTVDQVLALFNESGLSRIPVYRENMDKIVGILYAKDFIDYKNVILSSTKSLMHKPTVVNETSLLDNLLEAFRRKKIHFAVVQDDFGGTAGIVTMEDLLEEIVGEIRDEFDDAEDCLIWKQDDGSLLLQSNAAIYDINEQLGTEKLADEEHDSISALVYSECGFIPAVGKKIILPPAYEVEILEGDEKGIHKLLLCEAKLPEPADQDSED